MKLRRNNRFNDQENLKKVNKLIKFYSAKSEFENANLILRSIFLREQYKYLINTLETFSYYFNIRV